MKTGFFIFIMLLATALPVTARAQQQPVSPSSAQLETGAPAEAEQAQKTLVDHEKLHFDLTRHYRYVNQKCEFSFQLPEAPTSIVLWGESELPTKIVHNPGIGEIGEQVVYHRQSLDRSDYFEFDSWCLYGLGPEMDKVNVDNIKQELSDIAQRLNFRNVQIKGQQISPTFTIATLHGLTVDASGQNVKAHYFQYMKGPKSLMIMKIAHDAESGRFDALNNYIQDSLIYEER